MLYAKQNYFRGWGVRVERGGVVPVSTFVILFAVAKWCFISSILSEVLAIFLSALIHLCLCKVVAQLTL